MNSMSKDKDGASLYEIAVEDSTREWLQEYPLLAEKTPGVEEDREVFEASS
jgi:hypothetical protein